MSHKTLPYLTCLKTTCSSLSALVKEDAGAAMQIAIVGRLLDFMIAQRAVALALKAECYMAMRGLLSDIEKLLVGEETSTSGGGRFEIETEVPADSAAAACQELKTICTTSDIDDFERFLQLTAEMQRRLFALDSPSAVALCKAIVRMEWNYNEKFEADVDAHAAANVAEGKAATARNARDYDEGKLLDFIRKSFPAEAELGIKQSGLVSGGFSKFTVSITLSNARTLPETIILRGDANAAFGGASVVDEYRLFKTMYEHGVCIPKPLAVEESGTVFGSPFMLVEKRPSTVIGGQFEPPKPNRAVCQDVAVQLAAVHRVPLAAVGSRINGAKLRSSERALTWVDEALSNWKRLDIASPVFETALEWLRRNAHINDSAPRTLVHGDFVLNNILVYDDKVSAILDWEFAHIGNPAYDLGYFYYQAKGLASWEEFLQAYGAAGVPIPDEKQLNYNILLAATRLGVMVSQVMHSFTSGAEPGLAGAAVVSNNYYEQMVGRISRALDNVL